MVIESNVFVAIEEENITDLTTEIKQHLQLKYEMKDLGSVKRYPRVGLPSS